MIGKLVINLARSSAIRGTNSRTVATTKAIPNKNIEVTVINLGILYFLKYFATGLIEEATTIDTKSDIKISCIKNNE